MAFSTQPKNLTTREAADLLGVSHHTVIHWRRPNVRAPALPYVKIGRLVFYRPADVRKLARTVRLPPRDAGACGQPLQLAA